MMTHYMPRLMGRCHCGNLALELESSLAAEELPLRACQCTFCRGHGAMSTSAPAGVLTVSARDAGGVVRYRFGLGITDFLICGRCGIFVAAFMEIDGRERSISSHQAGSVVTKTDLGSWSRC